MSSRMVIGIVSAAAIAAAMACSGANNSSGPSVQLSGCLQPGSAPNTYELLVVGGPNGSVGTTGTRQTGQQANPSGNPAQSNSSDVGAATTRVYTLIPGKVDLARDQGMLVSITGHVDKNDTQGLERSAPAPQGADAASHLSDKQYQSLGNHGNPTTGEGPQSSVQGPTANRPLLTVHVDAEHRLTNTCSR